MRTMDPVINRAVPRRLSGAVTVFFLFVVAANIAGCGPRLQKSSEAEPWPLLNQDPREAGNQDANWPMWRGPNASGIAASGSPAVRFGPEHGVRWKIELPGEGNSSPVVWENTVLLTAEVDTADPPMLQVLAYRRSDGTPLWHAEVGQAVGTTHSKNGYASASVATDGQRIFAFFGTTGLFCFDFEGKQLWRAELGKLDHIWGTASSPVLVDDLVIQLCDNTTDPYIAAFEQHDGQQVWRTPRPGTGSWSTPVLVETTSNDEEIRELVVNGSAGEDEQNRLVVAYDPTTGEELWRVAGTTQLVTPTPVVAGGLVFCASGRNGPIMAIRPGGRGDVTESHVVWRQRRGGPYIPSPVAYRNRLFVLSDARSITCYNAGNGQEIWRGRLGGVFTSSLVAADGRIYAINEQGHVFVVAANDEFELLAENDLQERCLTTPAVVDGQMFLRTERHLYCFAKQTTSTAANSPAAANGARAASSPPSHKPAQQPRNAAGADWPLPRGDRQATGVATSRLPEDPKLLWTFTVEDGGFETTPAIAEDRAFIGGLDGPLYAIDLASGKQDWAFSTELGFLASPSYHDGKIFVGDVEGRFYCLDAQNGQEQWRFQVEAEINSSANFDNDRVLFGSQDGYLYCLDSGGGKLVWKYQSEDQIRCFPSIVDRRAFVAGCDGRLHVIDLDSGREVAAVDIEAPTGSAPALHGPLAYVGTEGNTFFAIDWKQAKIRWRYENPDRAFPFRSSAAVSDRAVVVGSRDKLVHALDPKSGEALWTFATGGRVDGSPVIVGDRVFAGSADGRLFALDLESGEPVWQFETGGSILASPAVAQQRLIVATDDGSVFCFGSKQ